MQDIKHRSKMYPTYQWSIRDSCTCLWCSEVSSVLPSHIKNKWNMRLSASVPTTRCWDQWPLLLTWFNLNPSTDKKLHPLQYLGWNHWSIPKLQRCNRWSLGMDMLFHPTFNWACDYLSMLGLKLNHVSKRGNRIWRYKSYSTQINSAIRVRWRHIFRPLWYAFLTD